MRKLKVKTPPSSEPITTAEAKTHLRVSGSADDTYIDALIKAARQSVEEYTDTQLLTATYQLYFDDLNEEYYELPKGPVQSIVQFSYKDSNGDSQTLASGEYIFDTISNPARVYPQHDNSWPSTNGEVSNVCIEYSSGYSAASGIPEPILQAMRIKIAALYDDRQGDNVRIHAANHLLSPYRVKQF